MKIAVAVIWLVVTSVLVKYSLILGFDHDPGIWGPLLISMTILWLYSFFKNPTTRAK